MSDLRIQTLVLGAVSTNCYVLYHNQTKRAVIVDPADEAERIRRKCEELALRPEAILLTHGHFDHIMAVEDVKRLYGCEVWAGWKEEKMLLDPALNLTGYQGMKQVSIRADHPVRDNEVISLIGFDWKVLETPGHTAGSVCYYIESEEILLSGDTLFEGSLGRTDFPTGSSAEIVRSIRDRLLVLPEDTMVYPGHGDPTVIKYEKKYNPVAVYYGRGRR
ncbi:MAG: MBL fold metallo-hydrolase [Clostridiales bacterium]|nr:MBL fold metallo-hydrolase [Clostridiales bacterium]